MKKQNKNETVPTSAELNLLNILWQLGPSTVRQVHAYLNKTQKSGYTTVLKIFQIMYEKGLVTRDETNRAHVYASNYSEKQAQKSVVNSMLTKVFGGSKYQLVVRALDESASSEEIAEIRQLLDQLEESNNKN